MRFRLAVLVVATAAGAARADTPQCHVVDATVVPSSDDLQIVAWVEKTDGTFVDTIFITQKVGTYGMGNRPGRFDFNSGPVIHDMWPYGRRTTTFPVWAHRHGLTWPQIEFQDGHDSDLSHSFDQSSPENTPPYCRPLRATNDPICPSCWDAGTCASQAFTDKGVFANTISLYPPRADIVNVTMPDSASVGMYQQMNPFDAVSQATPPGGAPYQITWPIPLDLPLGDYVMFLEVSRAFDFNGTYTAAAAPGPTVPYGDYGQPYRGQPSVVYSVPFHIGTMQSTASTTAYVGYGDPLGMSGAVNPPDATITTDTPGSGASRLAIIPGSTGDRVQVLTSPETNTVPPDPISQLDVGGINASGAMVTFVAPAAHDATGKVAGYDIKIRASDAMTAANFAQSMPINQGVPPMPAGSQQSFLLTGLLPQTDYWVGIRSYDQCRNYTDIQIIQFTTTARINGEVDACFVATAAYGTIMANDVEALRRFRDVMLESNVLGEIAVESYYTFGPPVARVVGVSELLRATARAALAPIIAWIR